MKAGRLRQRVIIDEAVDMQDVTTGAVEVVWIAVKSVWAEIEPLRGREGFVDGGILAAMDTKITIRKPPGFAINAKHRLRRTTAYGETIYNIVSPAEVGMSNRTIELACKSGLNQG